MLELLVVFVIVGLVSTLLMQGLGFGLSLFERVQVRSETIKQDLLVQSWFRQVNQSLVAKVHQEGPSLVGNSLSFEATTLNPLLGEAGVAKQVQWSIEDGALWYRESPFELKITEVRPTSRLQYKTQAGGWQSQWPVGNEAQLLPKGVAIDPGNGSQILAVLRVRSNPDVLLEESRRERE